MDIVHPQMMLHYVPVVWFTGFLKDLEGFLWVVRHCVLVVGSCYVRVVDHLQGYVSLFG